MKMNALEQIRNRQEIERPKFEKWVTEMRFMDVSTYIDGGHKVYINCETQAAWIGWYNCAATRDKS